MDKIQKEGPLSRPTLQVVRSVLLREGASLYADYSRAGERDVDGEKQEWIGSRRCRSQDDRIRRNCCNAIIKITVLSVPP